MSEKERRLAFIKGLRAHRDVLPPSEIHTLTGQALHGDLEAAQRKLTTTIKEYMPKQG